ncbi:fluoride efflux transporter FluC [Oceanobacillus kapialis]|uniref:fluoride efflux transporter FluC n=1 Tax=Oceanobacillus kapialis TaxID=481353 RepID=UPI00384FEB45
MKAMKLKMMVSIGIGGMLGAVGRYAISLTFLAEPTFPYPTLIANLIGCFLLSFLLHTKLIKRHVTPIILNAFTVGMIGAFTTFSTLALETITLWRNLPILAAVYVFISITAGIACCFLGVKLAYRLERSTI